MGATRDYYADLELPPTADIADIKKQFRKLALKYHPDRNPGREAEVNAQFQIIQSAHEVLSDPAQKQKYDATRGRGKGPGASGVRGNPWATAGDHFPPPPTRRNPNAPNRNANPDPSSGARRWQTRFSQGVPPTAKQKTDAETKKGAASAFEKMRKGQSQPGRAGQEPRPTPPPPPPRAEYAKQRAEASFGKTKSAGFHPRSTNGGDEPPVPPRNYSTTTRADEQGAQETNTGSSRPVPPIPDPLQQFRDNERGAYSDPRQSTPYSRHGGEKTNPFDGVPNVARAKSTREAYSDGRFQSDNDPSSNSRHRSSSVPRNHNSDEHQPNLSVPQNDQRPHTAGESANTSFRSRTANASYDKEGDANGPSIFNFSVDDETFENSTADAHRFTRSSVDDINTRFVDEEGPSAWEFSAGSGDQDSQPPTSRTQSRNSRKGHRSPTKRPNTMPRTDSVGEDPSSGSSKGGFNADGWSDKFGPQTFVPQPTQNATASPTRASRANSKKSKSTKTTAGSAAVVEDSSSDADIYEWRGRRAQGSGMAESPQAMDIDSPSANVEANADEQSQTSNMPRNIHVEPSRPDWRPGNVDGNGVRFAAEQLGKPPSNPNAAGSEDSEEFRASFADLKKIAPIAQPKSGLKSFEDLKDNLPFESKAANNAGIKTPKAQPLVLPPVPEAPRPPPTLAIDGMKVNVASWSKYVDDFQNYLQRWDSFNGQVVDHFATRKKHVEQTRQSKGYSFLAARGDDDIYEYYNWVAQDNDVRRRWNEACVQHEQHFREFMAFRERMK